MDSFQQLLLDLFSQVARAPNAAPRVPVDRYPEGSPEHRLLAAFTEMLGSLEHDRRQLRAGYEDLVNSIDGIVWEADAETVAFSFVSDQAERLLGYPTSRWVTEPTFWQDHIHPEDRAWAIPFCAAAAAERRPHEFEYRMIAADGRIVWVRDIVTVVDAEGGSAQMRGVMVDITEQKRAEEALRQREAEYRSIFESTSDGLFINTLDGQLVDFNPAAARMHGYTVEEFRTLQPPDFIHPDSLPLFRDYLEAVRAGHSFRGRAVDRRKNGSLFHVEVNGKRFSYRGRPHTLAVLRDVTEEVEAYQLLEQRVAERTREVATLLQVSQNVASTLELSPLLDLILGELRVVAAYDGAALSILEGEELVLAAYRGPAPPEETVGIRRPARRSEMVWRRLERREFVVIDNIHDDTPLAESYRRFFYSYTDDRSVAVLPPASTLLVPLVANERVIGYLGLFRARPGYYTEHHANLVTTIANQAASAISNARLYQAAQEEARKTAALARVASSLALGADLDVTLHEVARNVVEASEAVGCVMIIVEGDDAPVRVLGDHGMPEGYAAALEAVIRGGHRVLTVARYHEPGPLIVRDMRRNVLSEPGNRPLHHFMAQVTWDTMVSLPMVYRERQLGRLNLYYPPNHAPDEEELAFLGAVANQAAAAIENARLYEQARNLAALEERQRLARELHDSVSQALYGIALGTRTAQALHERNEAGVADALEYIRSLAAAGMAEMRALIFELRPESLETEGLVAALAKQAASLAARNRVEVVADLPPEPELPLEIKEALYRIAQEAMHNTVKHAQARSVHLGLRQTPEGVVLDLRDDGVGFDAGGDFPGHLGLKSMRERVVRLGGSLSIHSTPGQGTSIQATIPVRRNGG